MKWLSSLFGSNGAPKNQTITIVSGLPRSGTSLMMKMLVEGGMEPLIDQVRQADEDNPQGYYEFERVKRLDKGDSGWLIAAKGKVVKVISALLPHLPPIYSYQVIFMERALNEVVASQRKMLNHRHEAETDGAELVPMLASHLAETKQWLASQRQIRTLYVDYNLLLAEPTQQVNQLAAFLKRPLNTTQMIQVVTPTLYRNRQPVPG